MASCKGLLHSKIFSIHVPAEKGKKRGRGNGLTFAFFSINRIQNKEKNFKNTKKTLRQVMSKAVGCFVDDRYHS